MSCNVPVTWFLHYPYTSSIHQLELLCAFNYSECAQPPDYGVILAPVYVYRLRIFKAQRITQDYFKLKLLTNMGCT